MRRQLLHYAWNHISCSTTLGEAFKFQFPLWMWKLLRILLMKFSMLLLEYTFEANKNETTTRFVTCWMALKLEKRTIKYWQCIFHSCCCYRFGNRPNIVLLDTLCFKRRKKKQSFPFPYIKLTAVLSTLMTLFSLCLSGIGCLLNDKSFLPASLNFEFQRVLIAFTIACGICAKKVFHVVKHRRCITI